jgi:AcrR family transcriptional regulator
MGVMSLRRKRDTYHHGNLKAALIAAADRMIEVTGVEELSLRGLAAAVGVSRMAAYNHFEDKEALLAEIVRLGFEDLGRGIPASVTEGKSPREVLALAAQDYLDAAARRPERFRLMFARSKVNMTKYPEAMAASQKSYASLEAIVSRAVGGDGKAATLAAWSLIHGYATLRGSMGADFNARLGAPALNGDYFAAVIVSGARSASVFAEDTSHQKDAP